MWRRRPGRPGPSAPAAVGATTPPATRSSAVDARPLVDPDPALPTATRASPRHNVAGSTRTSRPGRPIQAGLPDGGVDLGLDRLAVQELERARRVRRGLVHPRPELLDLVRLVGQGQRAGLLEIAVDAVLAGERDELAEGCRCPRVSRRSSSSGKCRIPLARPWVSDRLAEAAVPAARPEGDRVRLQDDDVERGSVSVRASRGPQPGEPGPDDDDIGRRATRSGPGDDAGARFAQPVADGFGRMGPVRPRSHRSMVTGRACAFPPCPVMSHARDSSCVWSGRATNIALTASQAPMARWPGSRPAHAQRPSRGPGRHIPHAEDLHGHRARRHARPRASRARHQTRCTRAPCGPCPVARTRTSGRGATTRSTSIGARAAGSGTWTATSSSTCGWATAR